MFTDFRMVGETRACALVQAAGTDYHQEPAAKRRRLDSAPGKEPASSRPDPPAGVGATSPELLATLPTELLARVLSFLSAEDLTVLASTCKLFQSATAGGTLWRRLYTARCLVPQCCFAKFISHLLHTMVCHMVKLVMLMQVGF